MYLLIHSLLIVSVYLKGISCLRCKNMNITYTLLQRKLFWIPQYIGKSREREREREGERHHDIIALFYLICVLLHQKLPVNIKPVSISLFMTWFWMQKLSCAWQRPTKKDHVCFVIHKNSKFIPYRENEGIPYLGIYASNQMIFQQVSAYIYIYNNK